MTREELLAVARKVALRAHCPYSRFHVGAAVMADGKVYVGVNVENSSYGLTLCAERAALAAAISDGAGHITHVAVACIDAPPDAPLNDRSPCGACRQWIADLEAGVQRAAALCRSARCPRTTPSSSLPKSATSRSAEGGRPLPECEVSSHNSFLPAAEGGKIELLNRPGDI